MAYLLAFGFLLGVALGLALYPMRSASFPGPARKVKGRRYPVQKQRSTAHASTLLMAWYGCVLLLPSGYGYFEVSMSAVAHPTLALCACFVFAVLSMCCRCWQQAQGIGLASWLRNAGLVIVTNDAEGECWWLASHRWHGMTPEVGRRLCARSRCHDLKVQRAFQSPGSWQNPTDTEQIKHAVDVLGRDFCPQGLIVMYGDHTEVAGVWFQAGSAPVKVTADVAQQLAKQESGPQFMLYTRSNRATPGHFEDLIPKRFPLPQKATRFHPSGFVFHVPLFVGGMDSETPNPRPRQRFRLADFQPVIDVEALTLESESQAAQAEPPLPPVAAMPSSWRNLEGRQPWLQRLRTTEPSSADTRADAVPPQAPPLRPLAPLPASWGWLGETPRHEPGHELGNALEPSLATGHGDAAEVAPTQVTSSSNTNGDPDISAAATQPGEPECLRSPVAQSASPHVPQSLAVFAQLATQPIAEVAYWVEQMARAPTVSAWRSIPLWSQYLLRTPVETVLHDCLRNIRARREHPVRITEAEDIATDFGKCIILPVAVLVEYAASKVRMPAAFFCDLLVACLASTLHTDLIVLPYADTDDTFSVRPRYWACPVGDPSTGKSPTFRYIMTQFHNYVAAHAGRFPWIRQSAASHIYGRGSHAGLNEVLRDTGGVALLATPEGRACFDPSFPSRLQCDSKSFLNFLYLLETATGGPYEWVTATDIRTSRAATKKAKEEGATARPGDELQVSASHADPCEQRGRSDLLRFESTSVNMCLYQQPAVVRSWWAQIERRHDLGFCSRVIFSFSKRGTVAEAPVGRAHGSSRAPLRTDLCQRLWEGTADFGHHIAKPPNLICRRYLSGWLESLVHELDVLLDIGGWGTATKAVLGKVETVVAAYAGLNHVMARSLEPACGCEVSACSFKAAIRFFDLRMALGTSVIDAEATDSAAPAPSSDPALPSQEDLLGRILRSCPEDPITYTDMSKHLVRFRKDGDGEERRKLMIALAELGLGECHSTQARGANARQFLSPPLKFTRGPLTPSVRDVLVRLKVPVSCWPERPLAMAAAESEVPPLRGAGKQCMAPARLYLASPPLPFAGKRAEKPDLVRPTSHAAEIPVLSGAGKSAEGQRQAPKAAPKAVRKAASKPAAAAARRASAVQKKPAGPPKFERRDLCSVPIQRAPDADRVEQLINAHLQQHGPKVEDTPIQVKAASRMRKDQTVWFQLRCFTCDPKSCTWSGGAQYNAQTSTLQAWELSGRSHGALKQRKKASGRKQKGMVAGPLLAVQEVLEYTGEVKQNKFHEWIRRHFANRPLAQSLRVHCKPRKQGRQQLFYCGTHVNCPWRGRGKLIHKENEKPQILLKYCNPEAHSKDDRVIHGTLTWQQRQVVFRGRSSSVLHASRDLKRLKRQTEDGPQEVTPPTKAQLTGFMRRFRKKLRQPNFEPRSSTGLDASAFQYCMDQANGSLGGSTLLLPDDARLRTQDTQLRVLNPVFNGSELTVPIICPALVNLVLSLLPQPWHIKLSLDGTYRLVICSKYVLLNAGVNVKHWVHDGGVKVPEFRSRYVPLAFAIAHVEAEDSYARLTDSLLRVGAKVRGQDGVSFGRAHIGQWHGDLHRGLEKARRAVVPDAVRLSDWAHCCGVTSPGPGGWPALLATHLGADDPLLHRIRAWFPLTRFMPKYVFHIIWTSLFEEMQPPLRAALQREYFLVVNGIWSAHWRAAPDRIAPASATGTAAQEAWHGATLKQMINCKHTPHGLVRALQEEIVNPLLTEMRGMQAAGQRFNDWPGAGQHVNLHVLKAEGAMEAGGRTCAINLLAWGLHQVAMDERGNHHFLMPVSKWRAKPEHTTEARKKKDKRKKDFVRRDVLAVSDGAALAMGKAMLAQSCEEAEEALIALGIWNHSLKSVNWSPAYNLFFNWRHVVVGPAVQDLWQIHGCNLPVEDCNTHGRALCFLCEHAGKWGPCEHAYAALLQLGVISVEPTAGQKAPRARGRPAKRSEGAGLCPGNQLPRDVERANVPAGVAVPAGGSDHAASPLTDILRAAGLAGQLHTFQEQGATLEMLGDLSLADYGAFFSLSLAQAHRLKRLVDGSVNPAGQSGSSAPSSAAAAPPPNPAEESGSAAPASAAAAPPPLPASSQPSTARPPRQSRGEDHFRGLRQTYGGRLKASGRTNADGFTFLEVFSGPNAPLSQAVAGMLGLSLEPPKSRLVSAAADRVEMSGPSSSEPDLKYKQPQDGSHPAIQAGSPLQQPQVETGKYRLEAIQSAKRPSYGKRTQLIDDGLSDPEQHFVAAKCLRHPFEDTDAIKEDHLAAVEFLRSEPANINCQRLYTLERLKRLQAQFAAEQRRVNAKASWTAKKLGARPNTLLMEYLQSQLGVEDQAVPKACLEGLGIIGVASESPFFTPFDVPPTVTKGEYFSSLESRSRKMIERVQSMGESAPAPLTEAIYAKTLKEVAAGSMGPPQTFEYFQSLYGSDFQVVPSFGLEQGTDSTGKRKFRRIDDHSACWNNQVAHRKQKVPMTMVDYVALLIRVCGSSLQEDILLASDDMQGAYRQVALLPEHARYSITAVYNPHRQTTELFEMYGQPFGAGHSVPNFCRVAEWLCRCIRRLFHLCLDHFFDDYFLAEPSSTATVAAHCFQEAFSILGFTLDPDKTQPPSTSTHILGVLFDTSQLRTSGKLIIAPKPSRVTNLTSTINQILAAKELSPALAASVVGKFGFLSSTLFGKVGRCCTGALRTRQYQTHANNKVTQDIAVSLRLMRVFLSSTPPREVPLSIGRPVIVYTDASDVPDRNPQHVLGAVLWDPVDHLLFYSASKVPAEVIANWIPKKSLMGQLELLAAPFALTTWRRRLTGRPIIMFIDNDGAASNLVKGYSNKLDSAAIVGHFWLEASQCRALIYIDRVESKSNLSDGPSRLDFSLLLRMGAIWTPPKLDSLTAPATDPKEWLMQAKPALVFFFLPIGLVVSIGLMNLVTAVLVENALENAEQEKELERLQLKNKVKGALPAMVEIFKVLDQDHSGCISREEIEHVPLDILPSKLLESISIPSMADLFELLDVDGTGSLTQGEFVEGLLNLVLLDVPIWTIQSLRLLGSLRDAQVEMQEDLKSLKQYRRVDRTTSALT
eukprot:s309_g8.t1